ncbi:hypothetical protein [Entomospira culicis]|uniref:Uncharacterized protein n=1 Tax=Entomospira culicis TaxID=2719989 RepID=A0A968GIG4_9SPIO|nr:hypothetical protein [Entomospira culicis]NIZ19040.1 hypothetical protein [Entomospira culicis]NIZ69255.1 hypothetical protein [Entomospira culicis]WDI37838.1 hypothetical protein PVA46_03375 [Entomospira culicis]WDI39466.1 hypothetical protein PVA47_03380 [Entomospira culicis]
MLHYRAWYQFLGKYGVTKESIRRGFFAGFSLCKEPLRTIYLQNSHFEAQLKAHRHRMRREARPLLLKGAIVLAIIYLLTFFLFGR